MKQFALFVCCCLLMFTGCSPADNLPVIPSPLPSQQPQQQDSPQQQPAPSSPEAPAEQQPEQPPAEPAPEQQAPAPEQTAIPEQPVALAGYHTPIVDKKPARLHNIELALASLNKATVPPGETFSFNRTVGPRTPERGYQKAIIYVDGEEKPGYGGGICQVSTTLYNAAMASNLDIVERHEHDHPVDYASKGKDATVCYGDFDLKFRNTTDRSIGFQASMGNGQVSITIVQLPS